MMSNDAFILKLAVKFRNNFEKAINIKYLHWLSQSFLADFLNSHLRFHLKDLWGEEKYLRLAKYLEDLEDGRSTWNARYL